MARGSGLAVKLEMVKIPLLQQVHHLATNGFVTGASMRNWAGYGHDVILDKGISAVGKALLTDPQTSGGLLVSCEPSAVDEVLTLFARDGFADAAVIGELVSGQPGVEVSS